jgi:hypothetical protein
LLHIRGDTKKVTNGNTELLTKWLAYRWFK